MHNACALRLCMYVCMYVWLDAPPTKTEQPSINYAYHYIPKLQSIVPQWNKHHKTIKPIIT